MRSPDSAGRSVDTPRAHRGDGLPQRRYRPSPCARTFCSNARSSPPGGSAPWWRSGRHHRDAPQRDTQRWPTSRRPLPPMRLRHRQSRRAPLPPPPGTPPSALSTSCRDTVPAAPGPAPRRPTWHGGPPQRRQPAPLPAQVGSATSGTMHEAPSTATRPRHRGRPRVHRTLLQHLRRSGRRGTTPWLRTGTTSVRGTCVRPPPSAAPGTAATPPEYCPHRRPSSATPRVGRTPGSRRMPSP